MKIKWVVLWRDTRVTRANDTGAGYATLLESGIYYRSRHHNPILHDTREAADDCMDAILRRWGNQNGRFVIRVVPRRVRR